MEKTLDVRILETADEIADLRVHMPAWPTQQRLLARAEKRLADLIAVRDGRAVEVYATVAANAGGFWMSRGHRGLDPRSHAICDDDSRHTILRGVAFLPAQDTIETEAESEEP